MIELALGLSMISAALLAWQIQVWFGPAVSRYRAAYAHDAAIQLRELFLFVDPLRLWAWAMLGAILTAGLMFASTGSLILAGITGLGVARLPQHVVRRLRARRLVRFERQLPVALSALASALRAGASLSSALRHIADHSEAPLAQEFGLLLHEQRLGVPFEVALVNLHRRLPCETSALGVAALRVSSHTGGNLAEILEGIAHTARQRMYWHEKTRSLTAQGRLQAWIVGALPLLLLGALSYLSPDAMAVMWTTPTGWGTLAVIAVLEVGGMLMIRRIVNIEM